MDIRPLPRHLQIAVEIPGGVAWLNQLDRLPGRDEGLAWPAFLVVPTILREHARRLLR